MNELLLKQTVLVKILTKDLGFYPVLSSSCRSSQESFEWSLGVSGWEKDLCRRFRWPCFIGIYRKPCAWCFILCLGSIFFFFPVEEV